VIITVDLGLPRWSEMFRQKKRLPGERYRVPLSAAADYGMAGDYHEAWNARLLNLMARAGLIALDYERPPTPTSDMQVDESGDDPDAHPPSRVLRILDGGHLEQAVWDQRVEPCRQDTARRSRRHFDLLKQAISSQSCISETLAEMYVIVGKAIVSPACGGCDYCRAHGEEPWATQMPPVLRAWPPPAAIGTGLVAQLRGQNAMMIFYSSRAMGGWKQQVLPAVNWLIVQGVRNIVLPAAYRGAWSEALAEKRYPTMIYDLAGFEPLALARAATLVLHPPDTPLPRDLYLPRTEDDDPRVVMLPEDTTDPSSPHRLLRDVVRVPSTTLDQLTRGLGL
jgi:hypothetical protein